MVNTNGKMDYQYSNVIDVYMTKNDVYISVGGSEGTYPGNIKCALYCISNGGYNLICDNYTAGDVRLCWWGKSN